MLELLPLHDTISGNHTHSHPKPQATTLTAPYKRLHTIIPSTQQPEERTAALMQGNGAGQGAMPVGPTPAGHQAELNIIYGMVEELSRQLAENRRVTEDIVSGLGRVRNRARERGLHNDEVLGEAADEIFGELTSAICSASVNPPFPSPVYSNYHDLSMRETKG
jgi:hypothetical protein